NDHGRVKEIEKEIKDIKKEIESHRSEAEGHWVERTAYTVASIPINATLFLSGAKLIPDLVRHFSQERYVKEERAKMLKTHEFDPEEQQDFDNQFKQLKGRIFESTRLSNKQKREMILRIESIKSKAKSEIKEKQKEMINKIAGKLFDYYDGRPEYLNQFKDIDRQDFVEEEKKIIEQIGFEELVKRLRKEIHDEREKFKTEQQTNDKLDRILQRISKAEGQNQLEIQLITTQYSLQVIQAVEQYVKNQVSAHEIVKSTINTVGALSGLSVLRAVGFSAVALHERYKKQIAKKAEEQGKLAKETGLGVFGTFNEVMVKGAIETVQKLCGSQGTVGRLQAMGTVGRAGALATMAVAEMYGADSSFSHQMADRAQEFQKAFGSGIADVAKQLTKNSVMQVERAFNAVRVAFGHLGNWGEVIDSIKSSHLSSPETPQSTASINPALETSIPTELSPDAGIPSADTGASQNLAPDIGTPDISSRSVINPDAGVQLTPHSSSPDAGVSSDLNVPDSSTPDSKVAPDSRAPDTGLKPDSQTLVSSPKTDLATSKDTGITPDQAVPDKEETQSPSASQSESIPLSQPSESELTYEMQKNQGLLHSANHFQKQAGMEQKLIKAIRATRPEWVEVAENPSLNKFSSDPDKFLLHRWRLDMVREHGGDITPQGETVTETLGTGAKVKLVFDDKGYPHLSTKDSAFVYKHDEMLRMSGHKAVAMPKSVVEHPLDSHEPEVHSHADVDKAQKNLLQLKKSLGDMAGNTLINDALLMVNNSDADTIRGLAQLTEEQIQSATTIDALKNMALANAEPEQIPENIQPASTLTRTPITPSRPGSAGGGGGGKSIVTPTNELPGKVLNKAEALFNQYKFNLSQDTSLRNLKTLALANRTDIDKDEILEAFKKTTAAKSAQFGADLQRAFTKFVEDEYIKPMALSNQSTVVDLNEGPVGADVKAGNSTIEEGVARPRALGVREKQTTGQTSPKSQVIRPTQQEPGKPIILSDTSQISEIPSVTDVPPAFNEGPNQKFPLLTEQKSNGGFRVKAIIDGQTKNFDLSDKYKEIKFDPTAQQGYQVKLSFNTGRGTAEFHGDIKLSDIKGKPMPILVAGDRRYAIKEDDLQILN
ncbi:MAG: hypothetical protein ABH832_00495, partial [bacterium]